MLYHLKYRHRPALAKTLADRLAEVVACAGWERIDALIPVPTTGWKRWRRGYNQAELLATELGRRTGLPVLTATMTRRRGRSQVGADYARRAKNVHGVFEVLKNREIRHRRVVVVDDVLTTGATAQEVTSTLMAAGARRVYVVTLTSTGRIQRRAS